MDNIRFLSSRSDFVNSIHFTNSVNDEMLEGATVKKFFGFFLDGPSNSVPEHRNCGFGCRRRVFRGGIHVQKPEIPSDDQSGATQETRKGGRIAEGYFAIPVPVPELAYLVE
jgi:hypothetical protein